jgi:hypothetical protein
LNVSAPTTDPSPVAACLQSAHARGLARVEPVADGEASLLADAYGALLASIRRSRAARLAAEPQRGEPQPVADDDGQQRSVAQ